MFDTILTVIFLIAGNTAFWFLILGKRARRFLVKALSRRYGSKLAKEDFRSGEVVVFCVAIVGEMAFALMTIAALLELSRR
jgi:hypothetical protein